MGVSYNANQNLFTKHKLYERSVVTKAVNEASILMSIDVSTLTQILGIKEPDVIQMKHNDYLLQPQQEEWERALLFIRLFKGIDVLCGGDRGALVEWLISDNLDLRGVPIELIQNVSGLVRIVDYLEGYQAKI